MSADYRDAAALEALAAELSDLGATVEHPGYVCVPCGAHYLAVSCDDLEVMRADDEVCVHSAIAGNDPAAEARVLHAEWVSR